MPKKIPIEDSGKMQYSSTFEEALQNCTELQGHVNLDIVFWEGFVSYYFKLAFKIFKHTSFWQAIEESWGILDISATIWNHLWLLSKNLQGVGPWEQHSERNSLITKKKKFFFKFTTCKVH